MGDPSDWQGVEDVRLRGAFSLSLLLGNQSTKHISVVARHCRHHQRHTFVFDDDIMVHVSCKNCVNHDIITSLPQSKQLKIKQHLFVVCSVCICQFLSWTDE